MDGTTRERLCQIQGVPLLERVVKYWARVEKFQASNEDLLIATYPKAGRVQKTENNMIKTTKCNVNNEIILSVKGTTWIQEVVDSILNEGDVEKCKRAPTQVRMPFLEMTAPGDSSSGMFYRTKHCLATLNI